jgi:hypothetical protein
MGGFIVGFTGTRDGMTDIQARKVGELIKGAVEFHHGDCIGADAQAHEFAIRNGLSVILHPPRDKSQRALCRRADVIVDVQDYIDRNHDIVDMSEILVAAPSGPEASQPRSGTWATVRYASKCGRMVHIVMPDGGGGVRYPDRK